ncbi:MAG: phosphoribosylformylglycinamidine synthase [Oscillospiraceae bacterium]|nr:phosphoribosylformylglycinamidine synthase [Oscillospiraceae bacterium]
MKVFRCYTEKKDGFNIEAQQTANTLRNFLRLTGVDCVRILNRYDVEGITEEIYTDARYTIFATAQTDILYDELPPDFDEHSHILIVEPLPGQFDQCAESCERLMELLYALKHKQAGDLIVKTAKLYIISGNLSTDDIDKIRGYLINSVEAREAQSEKPETLTINYPKLGKAQIISGFIEANDGGLSKILDDFSLAMDMADLKVSQAYFRDVEKRNPTVTELRVLDTYWSDHCRHTTFFTHIEDIKIDDPDVQAAFETYKNARKEAYGDAADKRPITMMDLATIAAKALRARGMLSNIEISEEVNACSIHIDATVNGQTEDWLLMFKNETHNHPTEVEPFGGASTCVGGAIRDPLSGRAYVYQAMRVTGAGDPRTPFSDTLPNKLPQRKLTTTAARGNCSYGNQIGLSAGLVHEIYHPGYVAKRMELGAVVGAVKAEDIIRETPTPGDKVILVGARTGRDGIGGATGSSKTQTTESLVTMAAEVQKGNAGEERKIQRLFLDPEVTKIIKKCNDFGAGGVSVAVGELSDGLNINLNTVRTKYPGMDGTEIAISESQERMAVVVAPKHVDHFIQKAESENLEAYVVADITDTNRMVMHFDGEVIVDISRDFLSTNGAVKYASVHVPKLDCTSATPCTSTSDATPLRERLHTLITDLRYCSQRGLIEMFDGTVGANVTMKLGGKTQSTPAQAMAALLPVSCDSETTTCSVMAYGFDPYLSSLNPFIGAKTAVVTSVAKLVAAGCDPETVYLSFQEYFERLHNEPQRWGKPFMALLGAFEAQMELGLAAIGGKDSMSGSFNDIDVPPTLVSFAIAPNDAEFVISPEFKGANHEVVIFEIDDDLATTKETWTKIRRLIEEQTIVSAWAVTDGGLIEGIFKMTIGNDVGFEFDPQTILSSLSCTQPGTIIAEVTQPVLGAKTLGRTISKPLIIAGSEACDIYELKTEWEAPLESIFPTVPNPTPATSEVNKIDYTMRPAYIAQEKFAKPAALILALPGTNSELDVARAISRAGGNAEILVVRNKTSAMLHQSIEEVAKAIAQTQILILPGGSTLGDEPDGSGKFIDILLRDERIEEATLALLNKRDGLMLGICNGFQALVRLGYLPFGKIIAADAEKPTLSQNLIGRHQAKYVHTRVASVNSPWMNMCNVGDLHSIAISHGEGRFCASDEIISDLIQSGQIATQYTCGAGIPYMDTDVNPNGSMHAIEGIFSPDGRIFGKMGHAERAGTHVAKNIHGHKQQPIFESAINYYK